MGTPTPTTVTATISAYRSVISTAVVTTTGSPLTVTATKLNTVTITQAPSMSAPSGPIECGLALAQSSVLNCLQDVGFYSDTSPPAVCSDLPGFLGDYEPLIRDCYSNPPTTIISTQPKTILQSTTASLTSTLTITAPTSITTTTDIILVDDVNGHYTYGEGPLTGEIASSCLANVYQRLPALPYTTTTAIVTEFATESSQEQLFRRVIYWIFI